MMELWPFTNFHDMNLDWIIRRIKNIEDSEAASKASEEAAADSAAEALASQNAAAGSAQAALDSENAAKNSETAAYNSAESIKGYTDQINANTASIGSLIANAGDGTIPSELSDIRIGWNGTTYTTAGNAVRDQIEDVIAITGAGLEEQYMGFSDGSIVNGNNYNAANRFRTEFFGVRNNSLNDYTVSINPGYRIIIVCYNLSGTYIGQAPSDPGGSGWLIVTGPRKLGDILSGNANLVNTHSIRFVVAKNPDDDINLAEAETAFVFTDSCMPVTTLVAEGMPQISHPLLADMEVKAGKPVAFTITSDDTISIERATVGMAISGTQWASEAAITNTSLGKAVFSITPKYSGKCRFYISIGSNTTITYGNSPIKVYSSAMHDQPYLEVEPDTIVVAASNSANNMMRLATYFCTGTNDELVIQQAIDEAATLGSANIKLLAGDYYIQDFPHTTGMDRPAALKIPSTAVCLNIEGSVSENGTRIHVDTTNITNQVDVFGFYPRSQNTVIVNYKNMRVDIADQNHPAIIFNNYYNGACTMEHIRMYATGFGAGNVPVQGLIGVRCSNGNPNGIGQEMRHVGVTGFYEGFQMGGEHVVAIECLGRNCYYSYTFGNYNYTHGVFEHPITLINCCDEISAALPLFNRNGAYSQQNNPGLQQVDFIGFNIESRPTQNPTLAALIPAEEVHPGTFCGRMEFTVNKLPFSYGNAPDFQLWQAGSGERFRTSNMVHKLGGTTQERQTYTPTYMQQYYDTSLNKMLIYDGTDWRESDGSIVQ